MKGTREQVTNKGNQGDTKVWNIMKLQKITPRRWGVVSAVAPSLTSQESRGLTPEPWLSVGVVCIVELIRTLAIKVKDVRQGVSSSREVGEWKERLGERGE